MGANYKLAEFEAALEKFCLQAGFKSNRWRGGVKATRNLIEVLATQPTILYVKESNIGEGFWGVNQNQLAAMVSSGKKWALVLLLGPGDTAFVMLGEAVQNAMKSWSHDKSDYKVHEGQELSNAVKFNSYLAVCEWLLK